MLCVMQPREFWAKARLASGVEGKKRIARHFCGSEQPQNVAQIHASKRAEAKVAKRQRGQQVPTRIELSQAHASLPIT